MARNGTSPCRGFLGAVLAIPLLAGSVGAQQPTVQAGGELPGKAVLQIEALLAAKAQRTPAQRKVSSQLLDPPGSAQQPAAAVSARQLTADVDAGSKSPARASAEARRDW